MKLSVFVVLGALIVAPAVSATAQTAAATTTAGQDKTLGDRIEKRLSSDASLKKYDIDVSVKGGVARLTGTVATDAERTKAAQLAQVSGITRVDNQLVTDLDAGTRHGVKGTAGKVTDQTKKGAGKTAEGAKKVGSKTGEAVTDGWITTRIKTNFMGDEGLRASNIDVDTDNHVVTLSGTVVSAAAHAKALQIAKDVEGVNRVVDRLRVVPK